MYVTKIAYPAVSQERHQTFQPLPKSTPHNVIHSLKLSGVSAKERERERPFHPQLKH